MKKITAILLGMALMVMFVVPAKSESRTIHKETVKSELVSKIVKEVTFKVEKEIIALKTEKQIADNHFELLEADRPPGFILAKANYALYKRTNKNDALINKDFKNKDWRLYVDLKPKVRRTDT